MRIVNRELFNGFLAASGNNCTTLAQKVGCTRQMISALGRGEKSCSPSLALRITAALNVVDSKGQLAPHLIFLTQTSRLPVPESNTARPKKAA